MYKLIVTDVDGTLLDQDSNLPDYNKEALLACVEKGIGVMLATGRTIDAVSNLVSTLGLKHPQITQGGAVIVDSNFKVISYTGIGANVYMELVKSIRQNGLPPVVCLSDGKNYYDEYHPSMEYQKAVGEKIIKVDSIETDYFAQHCTAVYINIVESDPMDSFLREKFGYRLQLVRTGKHYFDILNKKSTKGNALVEVLKLLGIDRNHVAAFGDSYNDLSMFEIAGLRIAVKNSYPDVLKKADIVTEENYNCGLGKAIYKHILK